MKKISTALFLLLLFFHLPASAAYTISIDNLPASVVKGESILLTASNGVLPYTWYSSNAAIATVNPLTGLFTALDTGVVTISVVDAIADSTFQTVTITNFKSWIPSTSMHVRDTLEVPIYTSDINGLGIVSANLEILLNSARIQFIGATTTGTLTASAGVPTTNIAGDTLKISLASGLDFGGTDSVFLKLRFRALDTMLVNYNIPLTWIKFETNEFPLGPTATLFDGNIYLLNDLPVFTHVLNDTTINEGDTLRFRFSAYDPNAGGVMFYLNSAPSTMTITWDSGDVTWPTTFADSGTYAVEVLAADQTEASSSHIFTVHVTNVNRSPVFTAGLPDTIFSQEGHYYINPVTAYDPDSDSLKYFLSGNPSGMTIDSVLGLLKWPISFSDSGIHSTSIIVVDGYGGKDSLFVFFSIADSNRSPIFSLIPSDTLINEGQAYTAHVNAIDPDSDQVKYFFKSANPPSGILLDSTTGVITWTPGFFASGIYTLAIGVTDNKPYGIDSITYIVTVLDVNQLPLLVHNFPDTIFTSETNYTSFNFDASDGDNDTVSFHLASPLAGMTIDSVTGLWEWTPSYFQAGTYSLKLKLQDVQGGITIDSLIVRVFNSNRLPQLVTWVDTISVNEGQLLTYGIIAQDPDSDVVRFKLVSPASGMTIDSATGIFSWQPSYMQAGIHYATVSISDGMDSIFTTTTITVFNINLPPIFVATLPDTAIAAYDTLKFHYVGFDPDSNGISIYLYYATPGASFDTSNVLTIVPSNSNGVYQIIVGIWDGFTTVYDTAQVRINIYGDVSGNTTISTYDASLVLQDLVSRITLKQLQRRVADVSADTTVSPFDASLILQHTVGLISGFPADSIFGGGGATVGANMLPKIASAKEALAPYSFKVEKGKSTGDFDLVIGLSEPSPVFGITASISFDTAVVKPKTISRETITDSMAFVYFFPRGKANFAFAGAKPLRAIGDIARFSFTLKNPNYSPDQLLFSVDKFVLNETDYAKFIPGITLDVKEVMNIPATFALQQNYPNPFNPTTTISYQLPKASSISITIYNMLGQQVKTLINSMEDAGYYTIEWNGRDNENKSVASGVYFYRMETKSEGKSSFVAIKKMLLMK